MKNLTTILVIGLLIFVGLACSFSAGKTGVVNVESAMLAKDNSGKPGDAVTNFTPSDKVQYFVVTLNEGKTGTRVKGVFTAVNADGVTEQKMAETEVITADDNQTKANFHISLPSEFPAGEYKADFFLNDKLAKTINYKVQ